jgi:dihydrolipoamide dehydrogenase
MLERMSYDVCVLGAGPGGYAAAMRAHDLGKRVALVERRRVGGAGIHAGALSSKTMWHLSNDYALARRVDRGYRARELEVSYKAVIDTVRTAVSEQRAHMMRQLDRLAIPSPSGGSVTLVEGEARFLGPHAVEVRAADGSLRKIEATHFVVATGSSPRVPEGIEIDGDRVITSDQIEELPAFPESMVIVGAGVIGCEYATIFSNFGRTKINIIDRQPRILPFEDEDLAEVVAKNFEHLGVTIHRESRLESLRVVGGRVEYVLSDAGGSKTTHHVERALVSIGRVPNTRGLGLEEIGVKLEKSGGVQVEATQSTVPNVWAVGDATMDIALVNVAELEGRQAVERMFGLAPPPIRYEALSAIMFLSPELAAVGLNEQQARQKKVPYRAATISNSLVPRYVAMRETGGFMKLLASPDDGRILGLRVLGAGASATIQGIAFLIDQGGTLEEIDRCVHPHPAVTEGVQECARALLGRSIHKVEVFGPELLGCTQG